MEVKTNSVGETQKIAQNLAKNLKGGDVLALYGDLGAGKTVFVQGLAQGLGIQKRILSPTFIFVRSYPFTSNNQSLIFHHVDLYRTQKPVDLKTLGLDEIFSPDSIVIIEWAEKIKEKLPKSRIDIYIERVNETTRKIKIIPPPMSLPPFTRHSRESLSTLSSRPKGGNPFRVNSRESKNWIPDPFGSTQGKQAGNDNKVSSRLHSNINKAAGILRSGGVVIFPTDTVYGIGCRFDDQKAIDRTYQIKGTPKNQPFPILVSSIKQVAKIAHINDLAKRLIKKYWPGGLTIILPGLSTYFKPGLKQLHKPGLEHAKLGFRMPNSDLVRSLIKKVGPLVGTSANFHGRGSVISSKDLDPKLTEQVDYVLQGKCEVGVESTVVDATIEPLKIIRQGAIKL